MLETLLIQNFQAHTKTRIDFDPTITTIVGSSDVGKSAILRALRWVCDNQPGGDAFIHHGSKGATVKLLVDGHAITRRRTPGGDVNEYTLDDQVFKAFGRGVPEPITKLLNLGPICWQGQHDAPYWFAETAGEVSRQLNSIVNLGVIDYVLARVATVRKRAHTKLELSEEALTTAKRIHDELSWVDGFDEALRIVEMKEAETEEAQKRATLARELVTGAVKHQEAGERADVVAQAGQIAVQAGTKAAEKRLRAGALVELCAQAVAARDTAGRTVPETTAMDKAFDKRVAAVRAKTALQNLIKEAREKGDAVWEAEKELTMAAADLPKACPTCGRS